MLADPEATARFGVFATVNLWDDFADHDPAWFSAPVFSAADQVAIAQVRQVLDAAAPALRADSQDAAHLRASPAWGPVYAAASEALTVFQRCNRPPEG